MHLLRLRCLDPPGLAWSLFSIELLSPYDALPRFDPALMDLTATATRKTIGLLLSVLSDGFDEPRPASEWLQVQALLSVSM